MKYMQVVAHTTGGEVKSASEQVTERDYDALKNELVKIAGEGSFLELNTEDGWVVVPGSQILYIEIKLV